MTPLMLMLFAPVSLAAPPANHPAAELLAEVEQRREDRCPMPETTMVTWAGGTWEWIGRRPVDVPMGPPNHARAAGEPPTGEAWWEAGPLVRVDACGDLWERVGEGHGESVLLDPAPSLASSLDGPDRTEPDTFETTEGSVLEGWKDSCGGNGRDHAIHDSDDRSEVTSFDTRAARSQVLIQLFQQHLAWTPSGWEMRTSPAGTCSGVMVDWNVVLTNAHCLAVQNSKGTFYRERSPNRVVVCSRGNRTGEPAVCSSASDVIVNPTYLGTKGAVDQDFAVAVLDDAVVWPWDTMGLSTDGPGTWDSHRVRQMAFHGYETGFRSWVDDWKLYTEPTCDANRVPSHHDDHWIDGQLRDIDAMALYSDVRPRGETNFSSTLVKTKTDGAGGSSGSPYFICPREDCDEEPLIIGLHSRYKWPGSHRRQGPRVDLFADFVEASAP